MTLPLTEEEKKSTGMVWRDNWASKPSVVVMSWSDPVAEGLLAEALLMLAEPVSGPVKLSNSAGTVLLVEIPEEHCNEAAVIHGIDLPAKEVTTNEEQSPDPDHSTPPKQTSNSG